MAISLLDIINRLPTGTRDKLMRTAKRAYDLGWTEHSNKLVAAKLLAHAKTLPAGRTKLRLTEMATFAVAHDEMCWGDFVEYFNNVKGWYPDPDLRDEIVNSFSDHPMLRKFLKKYLEMHYPDLTEDKW